MRHALSLPWLLAMLLVLAAPPLSATTMIAGNIGAGTTSNTNTGDYWVLPPSPVYGDPIGFMDPSNRFYTLIQLQIGDDLVAGTQGEGVYNSVSVGFWESDTNDLTSAVEVEVWNVLTPAMQSNDIFTLTSVVNPVIKPNEYYYLTEDLLPNPLPSSVQVVLGSQGGGGSEAVEVEPGTFVFSVTGNATPEPQSTVLVAAGFAGLLILLARRRYSSRQQVAA